MSGHTNPPHVVVAGTRRSWSRNEKRAILAEARESTTTISAVARRHALHTSLLFRWRRDARNKEHAEPSAPRPAFIALGLPAPASVPVVDAASGTIVIEVAGGHRIRAEPGADPAVLRGVIEALIGR